jgi:hypothetical protein
MVSSLKKMMKKKNKKMSFEIFGQVGVWHRKD